MKKITGAQALLGLARQTKRRLHGIPKEGKCEGTIRGCIVGKKKKKERIQEGVLRRRGKRA